MTSAVEHLSDRAQKCRSTAQVRNMLARAERMAEYYARLLAGWPAIVADKSTGPVVTVATTRTNPR